MERRDRREGAGPPGADGRGQPSMQPHANKAIASAREMRRRIAVAAPAGGWGPDPPAADDLAHRLHDLMPQGQRQGFVKRGKALSSNTRTLKP